MDRRTLLFVLCMAAAFFFVNFYFGTPKTQPLPKPQNETPVQKIEPSVEKPAFTPSSVANTKETLYCLQNNFMQLVFSNVGGAVTEINLPFHNQNDSESLVREIEFDRTILKNHPYNDYFPSQSYYAPETPRQLSQPQLGGYYPLIRRDLVLSPKGNRQKIPPQFYAMNVISDYPEVAQLIYEVKEFDKTHIVFEATQPHRKITKTFSLIPSTTPLNESSNELPYLFTLKISIEGDSRGLWLTSGVPEIELVSGSPSPILKYLLNRNGKPEINKIDLPKENDNISVSSIYPQWISNSNGYLGLIINPTSEISPGYKAQYVPGNIAPTRLVEIDQKYQRFKASDYPGYNMLLPLPNTGGEMTFRVFSGPYQDDLLTTIDKALTNPVTGENPDYSASQSFHGWFSFISEPFAQFLFILMKFFHKISGSWALSIILLTVALRVMLYPLNAWSFKSMRRMQELAPQVAAIQEKYKKDQRKAQIEVMNLYREKKANPFTGCFPILIQMPFLIGMFDLLKSTFELRGASFIPGWIDNLTSPDVLFSWDYPIFFIGTEFHLLPVLLGAVMYLQQKISASAPKKGQPLTDQQRQQKAMGNIMVVVFTIMFYNFPSGLNLYWLSSMLLGILQQWLTNRHMAKAKPLTASSKKIVSLEQAQKK